MHWNSFRFCIGPVPGKWFDIADEAGLLIQNEYFVWTGKAWHGAENQVRFDAGQMVREYGEWMRDNWNHPSVAIWDANNETLGSMLGEKILPAVRALDPSNRTWENSYNPPVGPDDPVEDHPYEFSGMARRGGAEFSMTTFERPNGKAPGAPSGHALILNEYGWTWLNRDGSPTELTKDLYPRLLPANATAEDRFALNAYLLAGITEFWRAYRQYAAVLHFVYLMSSDPLGYTADHFRDVEKLELEPHFRDYMSHAFAPLGVYLSFWQPKLAAGKQTFQVMLVNDEYHAAAGSVTVSLLSASGSEAARAQAPFQVGSLGQTTLYIDLDVPHTPGDFLLQAKADAGNGRPVLSPRRVPIKWPGVFGEGGPFPGCAGCRRPFFSDSSWSFFVLPDIATTFWKPPRWLPSPMRWPRTRSIPGCSGAWRSSSRRCSWDDFSVAGFARSGHCTTWLVTSGRKENWAGNA